MTPPSKKILVTGGLGFLGAPLVRALVKAGHKVRILDNASRGSEERLEDARIRVEVVRGDVRDTEAVYKAVRGMESVFHLAAVNGTRNFYEKPAHVLEVGVKGMVNILDACFQAGVGEIFFASSSEVYQSPPHVPTDEKVPLSVPDPFNPRYSYGGSKIIGELLIIHCGRESFRRAVIVRPHNVYGPDMGWDHVIPQLTTRLLQQKVSSQGSGEEIPLQIQGSGEQVRAFIYIDDFIDGLLRVFEHGEHLNIYNIGTTETISMKEVAEQIARCLGLKIQILQGPEASGGTPRRCPDITKIGGLGFKPRVSFNEGLRRTVEWYAAHAPKAEKAALSSEKEDR